MAFWWAFEDRSSGVRGLSLRWKSMFKGSAKAVNTSRSRVPPSLVQTNKIIEDAAQTKT